MTNGKNAKRQRQKEARKARLEQEMKEQRARKRRRSALLAVLLVGLVVAVMFFTQNTAGDDPGASPSAAAATATPPADANFATFVTSMGDIKVRLFREEAPITVANFVGLATGTKPWTDPNTGQPATRSLYNDTIFHRVIPNFMIQGGDPLGTGFGGPGYQFEDETDNGLVFDKIGLLAMANSGPDTNGSQFFLTVGTPSHLNGNHTIFGEVVSGQEVADAISTVPTVEDKPVSDVVLREVRITAE